MQKVHLLCNYSCEGGGGGGGGGRAPPIPHPPHQNQMPPMAHGPFPYLKMKPPHWKVKPASRKWFLEKTPEKSETVINICVSIIKQYWKKMAEIPQEHDFLTWGIQTLVRKVKQFVRKYYITFNWSHNCCNRHCTANGVIL